MPAAQLKQLEAAAFANAKTAAFGEALLGAGATERVALAFANAWTAESAAAVTRLRGRPFGAPLVLAASSFRVALGVGSSAATGGAEARATLDLALARARGGDGVEEVLSLSFDRAGLDALLEKLDLIQSQVDSLG